jgi:lysine 2,3-aminomutase
MLSPRRLKEIMADLADIDHVKIIRIHTRLPAADPRRITTALVDALKVKGAATWVALHANHPRELGAEVRDACARLIDAGIPMVSQSVLLRDVNDDAATLEALMRAFVEARIKPYYLHHGDLAPGTAHLRTTLAHGQKLIRSLRGRVSGLCQPDYVLDIPGGHGKAPVGPQYLSADDSVEQDHAAGAQTRYRVIDYCGEAHLYPPAGE